MLGKLLRFELSYHMRQVAFWVVTIVMFLYGLLLGLFPDTFGNGGNRLFVNGAQPVAGALASAFLPVVFFGGVFTVSGILRDKTSNMLEIVHATPVSTRDMTLSRMIGIFSIILVAFVVFLLGQVLALASPTIDAETLGPMRPMYYVQPFILFTLINALFATAFFTLIAGLTQNRMLVLVSSIGLFFLTLMTNFLPSVDAPKLLQAIADPSGGLAYMLDVENYTFTERNTKMLPLTGYVGLNRGIWGGASLVALGLVFAKFRRGLVTGKTRLSGKALTATGKAYAGVPVTVGPRAFASTLWTRTRFEYLTIVRSVPFMILTFLAIALFAIAIIATVFLSPQKLVPTSIFMSGIGFGSFLIPMLLIIAFFSGDIVFRDRLAKFHELLDATPVNNAAIMIAKWLAIVLMIATLCTLCMFIGMACQVFAGGPPIDLGIYLKSTFLNTFLTYLAFALIALAVQAVSPNRIVGMMLAMGAMVGTLFLGQLSFYHPLMGYGATSPGRLSEISPYRGWVYFRWFNAYWGSFIVALGVLGLWLWRRGLQTSLRQRLRALPAQMTPISGAVLGLAIATFIGTGVFIYQAYDKNDYMNRKDTEALQVRAEDLFKRELALPMPHTRAVELDIELYPGQQTALIKGEMALQNASGGPITEVYLQPPTDASDDMRVLELSGAVEVTKGENAEGDEVAEMLDYNVRLFRFDPPLADGATATLRYEAFHHAPRLADGSVIWKNGTFLNNYGSRRVSPVIGVPNYEITNPKKRRKLDLAPRTPLPDPKPEGMDQNLFGMIAGPADLIDLTAKVCTEDQQIPIAPGNLIEESRDEGRRCRTYRTDQPISNFYSILSGNYTVTEDSWTRADGRVVPIRVYHAKNHTYSVDEMIAATQFGLEHFTTHFSPYQYDYVRIMEVPFIGFAQAFAGTIPYAESGFIMDSGDPEDANSLDSATQTTMHELGHQWFGHQIIPGYSRGYNVLSEGLTSYAALDAYQAFYGFDKARYALEKGSIDVIATAGIFDSTKEVPLAVARDQGYLVYQKADWVLWSLKHYIGPQKLRDAMAGFLADYGLKGAPYPTTATLTDVLRTAAGPEYEQLITDQWDRIVWWDYRIGETGATLSENPDGSWRVTLPLVTDKTIQTEEMDKAESWTELDGETLNEPLEIGFYAEAPKDKWSAWQRLERVRVSATEQTLSFDVAEKPAHIAIDPRRLLQERNVEDNVAALDTAPAAIR